MNQALSEQRAAAIVSYLVSRGIPPRRLMARGELLRQLDLKLSVAEQTLAHVRNQQQYGGTGDLPRDVQGVPFTSPAWRSWKRSGRSLVNAQPAGRV